MKLRIPHLQQETLYTCLPACVRMVLAHLGETYQEAELATLLQTIPLIGTAPEQAKAGLESAGYHVLWFENATTEKLAQLLANNWPIILFFHAKDLPHGQGGLHASVLVQITTRSVVLLDPMLKN